MNRTEFWKTFKLGTELDIAGRFLYNGLRAFHEMETLYHEGEIFEVLYNLAVGLERLLKIAVILIEHEEKLNQEDFERSLITHNHLKLLARVQQRHPLKLGTIHNEFLQLLATFYKSQRYGRYSVDSANESKHEKHSLQVFITKYLKIRLANDGIVPPLNEEPIRKFIGKTIGKITAELYEVVKAEAGRLNIFTYELRNPSKAAKIFLNQEYTFLKEDVLWRELLIFMIHSQQSRGHIGFMRRLTPLGFDAGLEEDYLQCFGSTEKMLFVTDELDGLYEELATPGERLEAVRIIGSSGVIFHGEEPEGFEDSDDSTSG